MVSKKEEKTVKVAAPVKEVKAEPAKTVAAKVETKTAVKEAAPKKEAVMKAPAKKATEKKTEEVKTCNFYIQYAGKQFSYEDIIAKSKDAAAAEMGKKVTSVKTIDIYCKPEEHAAYYVANGKVAGRIDL